MHKVDRWIKRSMETKKPASMAYIQPIAFKFPTKVR